MAFPKERKFSCKGSSLCGITSKKKGGVMSANRAWILVRKAATNSHISQKMLYSKDVSKKMGELTRRTARVSVGVFISSDILRVFINCRWL